MIKDTSNKYKKRLINIICGIIGFISPVLLKIPILSLINTASYILSLDYYNEDSNIWLDIMIMVLVFRLLRKIIYYFIGNIKHTIVYEDGSKYVGTTIPFTEIRNGSGSAQWTNGDKYYGDFKDNFRTGDGVLIKVK